LQSITGRQGLHIVI